MRLPSVGRQPGSLAAVAALAALAACAPHTAPPVRPLPAAVRPTLPPIPQVNGPLAIRVVYPAANARIAARDSTFIFGSVGNGSASLAIDGAAVRVEPNGSFLAWLPVPRQPRYVLTATLGGRTVVDTVPVRLLPPRVALADTGRLRVDSGSVTPSGPVTYPAGEAVNVALRAPANARVELRLSSGELLALRASGQNRTQWQLAVPAARLAGGGSLMAIRGADTVRLPMPAVSATAPGSVTLVRIGAADPADSGDRRIMARPVAGGTYKWFVIPGTVLQRTAVAGGFARVQLGDDLPAWVPEGDAIVLPDRAVPPRRVVGNVRVLPAPEWVDVVLPMAERPPYLVEEHGDALVLTLYGTTPNTDIIHFAANDSLVRDVTWEPLPDGRAQYTMRLSGPPFGYLAFWNGDAFVLRVRRPPVVDSAAPLRGLRIAVDPGHPPIGATGPTGLYEADAVLAVGELLRDELQRRGATVTMTRTSRAAVALGDRPIIARRVDAHAFVSVHLNALPDGIDPFTNNGTGTYYFHPQSAPLARATQNALVRHLGLPDLGINYDNLAVVRGSWMPAILAEGAFLMIPAQEAALRTPEYQRAYALGLADGLEAYFRSLASAPDRAP